jgi:glucosylglycerol 3-phosphatase
VTAGPGDPRDRDDPLTLSVVFPGGHEEYAALFQSAAQARQGSHQKSRQK